MIDKLNEAIDEYYEKWDVLVHERTNREFFSSLQPTAVAWKVAGPLEYETIVSELRMHSDIVIENWWDNRWIAMLHLQNRKLAAEIEVVKLMQRRPRSTDAVGLDHLDFYSEQVEQADELLQNEKSLRWTHEQAGQCSWTSVWFGGTEAKLRTHTILDSCIRDLKAQNEHILRERLIAC